ncbi:signal peptidase I [Pseudonocardiaceae bacterium YIM PH 21723]|nr:signal peptidase I [Pseudonocardiaceae bacterium YIM PH 21723]
MTILIQAFLGRVFFIPSQSMEQTLHGCTGCTGDRVLVDKVTYRFSDPKPGDVIVFEGPVEWGHEGEPKSDNPVVRAAQYVGSLVGFGGNDNDFVKRIIAVGGQTVQCCDAQNRVLVDGKPLNEPYVYWEPGRGTQQQDFQPFKVPEGKLWVMGDNRNDSLDARAHGPIPVDNVVGKAQVIVLPVNRWGLVDDPNPQAPGKAQSLGVPGWQQGLPVAGGVLLAWPLVRGGRRIRSWAAAREK